MKFKRIKSTPDSLEGLDGDVRVNDASFCWRKLGHRWICEDILCKIGSPLVDVGSAPTIRQGRDNGEVAISPAGDWWLYLNGDWKYQGCLVDDPQDLKVNALTITGNFEPPLVSGRIPVYRRDQLVGYLDLVPVTEEDAEED